jgi:hypothetical protein
MKPLARILWVFSEKGENHASQQTSTETQPR